MRTQSRCAGWPFHALVSASEVSGPLHKVQRLGGATIQAVRRGALDPVTGPHPVEP